jgi:hypothetical protein
MAKFRSKNNTAIIIIASVLIAVLLVGVLGYFTKGFQDFDFSKDINEDNLLYGQYKNYTGGNHPSGITATNDDGVIVFNGKIPDTSTAANAELTFATMTLKAGTYTYSCFEDPSMSTYYSYISWADAEGGKHIVFADFSESNITVSGATVEGYKTFTLTEDTEVSFHITVCPGAEMKNVEALPCLVTGDVEGSFYVVSDTLADKK